MTTPQVEKLLNEIKKLPENKECPNCLSVSKVGHGNICVPFGTFVCSDCKSAHQAFSHRIKSVTMSIWTKDDVDKLRPDRGGSNENARRKFFARYDERRLPRPRKGDDHTVWKDFIKQIYIDKRFYDDSGDQGHDGGRHRSPDARRRDSSDHRSGRDGGSYGQERRNEDDLKRQTSRDAGRHRRHDDSDDDIQRPPRGAKADPYDHSSRSGSRHNDDFGAFDPYDEKPSFRDPYDDRQSTRPSSRRHDDHESSRNEDDDDTVRVRRKDRGQAPRTSAPRTARGEPRTNTSSSNSTNVDLLGDFTGGSDAGLANQMAGMSVSGAGTASDEWASFEGAATGQHHSATQQTSTDLFSMAQAPKAASPLPDLLSMYNSGGSLPRPQQPNMMAPMGMGAPMGHTMAQPMGMARAANPHVRPMGMPYGMAGVPQLPMSMGGGFNAAAPMGAAPMGMHTQTMPMTMRGPAPVYMGLNTNVMASANQSSVFDAFGQSSTPARGTSASHIQQKTKDSGKFNDLRW